MLTVLLYYVRLSAARSAADSRTRSEHYLQEDYLHFKEFFSTEVVAYNSINNMAFSTQTVKPCSNQNT